jgi:hypothetical protein
MRKAPAHRTTTANTPDPAAVSRSQGTPVEVGLGVGDDDAMS